MVVVVVGGHCSLVHVMLVPPDGFYTSLWQSPPRVCMLCGMHTAADAATRWEAVGQVVSMPVCCKRRAGLCAAAAAAAALREGLGLCGGGLLYAGLLLPLVLFWSSFDVGRQCPEGCLVLKSTQRSLHASPRCLALTLPGVHACPSLGHDAVALSFLVCTLARWSCIYLPRYCRVTIPAIIRHAIFGCPGKSHPSLPSDSCPSCGSSLACDRPHIVPVHGGEHMVGCVLCFVRV